jgi:hypothetical protein
MSDLELIARIPSVKGAVHGDLEGTFLEAAGAVDGEGLAAEMGFFASTLAGVGEELGIGALATVAVAGPARACLVVLRGPAVITALVEPVRALGTVEKAVENSFQGWA